MILSDGSNTFRLTLVDYQYPRNLNNYYDANWLMVQLDVNNWTIQDACLLTFEVERLANWFRNPEGTIRFIEFGLRFTHLNDDHVRVYVEHQDAVLDFPVDGERVYHSLMKQLAEFPIRSV